MEHFKFDLYARRMGCVFYLWRNLRMRHRHISIPATQRMGLITEDAAEKAAALNSRQGWMGIFV